LFISFDFLMDTETYSLVGKRFMYNDVVIASNWQVLSRFRHA
jgi:hypothetical protein